MKKRILVLILAFAVLVPLAACNKPAEQTTEEKEKVEITVALYMLTNSLDALAEDLVPANIIMYHVYDRLVNFVPNSVTWLPGIAKSWKQVDERTMEYEINLDYRFHNGDMLTMDDIVFSIMRIKEIPKVASVGDLIDSVSYEGTTLTIRGVNADNTLQHKIISKAVIMCKKYVEEKGEEALVKAPVGTGPYMVTEFTPGASARIEVYEGYPFNKPQIDIINFSLIFEVSPRYIALETGQIQATHNLTPNEIRMAEENPNLGTLYGDSFLVHCLIINTEREPFDRTNIRRALAYAFNREGFCSLRGGGRKLVETTLFIGADDFMRVAPDWPEFNLDKARELFEAEGYSTSNPLRFTLTCNTESDPGIEMYQSDLKSVGVEMSIEAVEFSVFLPTEGAGNFDLAYTPQPNMGNHPFTDVDRYDINMIGMRDTSRFYHPRAQEIIDQFRFIPIDDPKLKELANELTDIIGYEMPMIPIFLSQEFCAFDNRISGIEHDNRIISFRTATWTP